MATTIAEDMRKLTEDMIAASGMRLSAVGSLMAQTREALKGFCADRTQMAASQRRDLRGFTNELSRDVQELRRKARGMVKEFHKTGRQMSEEQSKRLADFVQGLARDVTEMLTRFDKERGHMSKELGKRIAREIGDIGEAVEQILKDTDNSMKEQHSGMAAARRAWRNMSAAVGRARMTGFASPATGARHRACAPKHATCKTRVKRNTAKALQG